MSRLSNLPDNCSEGGGPTKIDSEEDAAQKVIVDERTSEENSAEQSEDGGSPKEERTINVFHPLGHFYSPIVDPYSLMEREEEIWATRMEVPGIDFNEKFHHFVLSTLFPEYLPFFDYPAETPEVGHESENSFYLNNSQFGWLDAPALFVLLNYWKPKRMIEVGSGFSSLLTADVNQRFLQGGLEFSCIEPYPRSFLDSGVPGISEVLVEKVEKVPLSYFSTLGENDILFIDSSHVSKTGSDVNYLLFEVLPALNNGVIIHFHDIFLPQEYPKHWILEENRSWNEQYLVQALLMNSDLYQVLFGCNYAHTVMKPLLEQALGVANGKSYGGASLWIQKVDPNSLTT